MPDLCLHIVSFDNPYPPNYGGVIDVFYKLKALKESGVEVILHVFEYGGRARAAQLNALCREVHYYPRRTGWRSAVSTTPYIIQSRNSEKLVGRLLLDDHPILYEGLHSCFSIRDVRLKDRFKIYRESNIEHEYYHHLVKSERSLLKKLYYFSESRRLKLFEHWLKEVDLILAVSKADHAYYQRKFPRLQVEYLPSFHANDEITAVPGKGDFALYHGNLKVPENNRAVLFLINEVFSKSDFPLVVAGMDPSAEVTALVSQFSHISLVANPTDEEMFALIRKAHMHVLVTFQTTGLKLKLLNALFAGRHCLVNDAMVSGTGLKEVCHTANTAEELVGQIDSLRDREFTAGDIGRRSNVLNAVYSNRKNAELLKQMAFHLDDPAVLAADGA